MLLEYDGLDQAWEGGVSWDADDGLYDIDDIPAVFLRTANLVSPADAQQLISTDHTGMGVGISASAIQHGPTSSESDGHEATASSAMPGEVAVPQEVHAAHFALQKKLIAHLNFLSSKKRLVWPQRRR